MGSKNRMTGRGPGFPATPGRPFAERGPDALYRAWRPGTPLNVELVVNMKGTEYHRVEMRGIGTDGLPIEMAYRDHWDGNLGVTTFVNIRGSEGTMWERVYDHRPVQLRRDLS